MTKNDRGVMTEASQFRTQKKKASSSVNRVGSERSNNFLYIGERNFPFELDSGSDVSCICMHMLQDIQLTLIFLFP